MRTTTTLRRTAGRTLRRLRPTAPDDAGAPIPQHAAPVQEPSAPRTAILIVNGFDRRGRWGEFNEDEARQFPWVDLCLRQVQRHSQSSSYEVLVWDNSWIPEHRQLLREDPSVRRFQPREGHELRHGESLDRLVKKVRPDTEFIITLDTDSFPVRDGWIENLTGRLTDQVLISGVWRDEMLPQKPAFIHPCCLVTRTETLRRLGAGFAIGSGADVGFNLTEAVGAAGARVSKLHRSNRWNPHFLMGALYGDMIYHQGAGSRAPKFSAASDAQYNEAVRQILRDSAFSNLDDLIDALAGNAEPEIVEGLAQIATSRDQVQP